MMSCLEWSSMRAVDMIDILHLPDYTTAAISSAISFLTKGWVEVQSGEAAGLTSLLEVLQVGSGEERRREEEERSRVEVRRWVEEERRQVEEERRRQAAPRSDSCPLS